PTKGVAASASIMFLFLFFMVNLCAIKIRRSMADELIYGFMMPLFPLFPIIAIICQGILAFELREITIIPWIVAPAWIGVGFIIYHVYSKSRAIATEDEIHVLEEETHHDEYVSDKYQVMVAVANPSNAAELVQSTYKLCGAKNARVELIHMVPVPDQVALTDAEKYIKAGKEGLLEAMLYLSLHFPIKTTLRYCRNIARGIVSAVREKKTDMLVLGWHGKASNQMFNIGATVDPIIEQSPCNIVMLKDCGGNKEFKKVLVPVAGGPNGKFAVEIASIMAQSDGGTITVFTVDTGRSTKFDMEKFCKEQATLLNIDHNRLKCKTVTAKSAVLAIMKESRHHDLVVLGTTQKPLLVQMARQSLPEKIACRCKKPVVMVKSNAGVRTWIKRWI
ncbi:MAG: universal stress protein, partial [Anaerohalosphaera sp.]|nr:universal stress protein [Anaerohalosphaera sp.]